jgi:MFS family permease
MTYFRKRRAIAGGLAIAGSSLGGVIFPIMVVHLLPKVGFGWTMRICAFLILGLLIITNLTVSSYLQHSPKPFKLSQYLGPLREIKFILMCLGSFFLYCERSFVLSAKGRLMLISEKGGCLFH